MQQAASTQPELRSQGGSTDPDRQTAGDRLALIDDLLKALHREDIRYCHWKSNEHLSASLAGQTDLDVLVERGEEARLTRHLAGIGFKRCLSSWARAYPAIESFVGMDPATGTLVHLHVHYQLTVGERYLKGYRLPWESVALEHRVWDDRHGLWVIQPELELLLLLIRISLKARVRDRVRGLVRPRRLSPPVLAEWRWLRDRVDPARLKQLADPLIGQAAAVEVQRMVDGGALAPAATRRWTGLAHPSMSEYRSFPPVASRLLRWSRELSARWAAPRRLPQGGVLIAVLGADGSGKSTVTQLLAAWLARHLDTRRLYFGSGKGTASGIRRQLERLARLVLRMSPAMRSSARGTVRGHRGSPAATIGDVLWVLLLARERRRLVARARRLRNQGVVVVCDRWPQSRFARNDGPWLRAWLTHPSRWRRWVARVELDAIESAERLAPDLVLKLQVTPEVATARKAGTSIEVLRAKLRIIDDLVFPGSTTVVPIDATRPLPAVVLDAKHAVWKCL